MRSLEAEGMVEYSNEANHDSIIRWKEELPEKEEGKKK